MAKIQSIEVTFAASVELTQADQHALDELLSTICKRYVVEHPHRVMWPFGSGAKMLVHPMMLSDDEPIPFDESVYSVECAERENYDWPCSKCGKPLHFHMINSDTCEYAAAEKLAGTAAEGRA